MIRLAGAALLLLAAVLIPREFSRYAARRLSTEEGILGLFLFLRRELSCFSRPVGQALGDFRNEALAVTGFPEALRQTEDMAGAAERTVARMPLSEDFRALFLSFADSFGKGYREEEVRRLDAYAGEAQHLLATERRRLPAVRRLVSTLSVSVCLGLLLLFL